MTKVGRGGIIRKLSAGGDEPGAKRRANTKKFQKERKNLLTSETFCDRLNKL